MDTHLIDWERRRFLRGGLAALVGAGLLPVALPAAGHTVRRGDTLSEIAVRYGVSVAELRRANGLQGDTIRIGQTLTIPARSAASAAPASTVRYTVRRGDTLSGIAHNHGVSVAAVKRANGLSGDVIHAGQTLSIPLGATGASLLAGAKAATAKIRVDRGRWNTIVVHHSGIKYGNAESYGRYHKEQKRMQNGLAYHFVIGNGIDSGDGEVEVGPRWTKQLQGGHVRNHAVNQTGIGICLVGNFMETRPTTRQIQAFTELMTWLRGDVLRASPRFAGHREIDGPQHTVCPGRNFPLREMHARFD